MWKTAFFALCVGAANWAFAEEPTVFGGPTAEGQGSVALVKHTPHVFDQNTTVLLKVSIIRIAITKLRLQGIDFEKLLADDSSDSAAPKQKPAEKELDLFGESSPGTQGCLLLKQDDKFFSIIRKFVKDGTAEIVAQPKLVTSHNRAASFLSGGEFPVPVPQSAGTTTVEWKRYGTQVDFVPVVSDRETIRLEIRTTLSELDEDLNITVADTTIHGLRSASMDTAFRIKTNQIAVISGARKSRIIKDSVNSAEKQNGKKSAATKDSPKESCEETMLLMLIKPEIVEPMK